MPFDDDAEADNPGFRPPPHPDDRLWRHPSEMSANPVVRADAPGGASVGAGATTPGGQPRRRSWAAFVVAGTVGAVVAGGGVMLLGLDERVVERPVTERVALNPTASALGSPDGAALDSVRQRVAPAVVAIEPAGAGTGAEREAVAGSGVVVRDDGIVVTSIALVPAGAAPRVRLPDGTTVIAELVGTDAVTGLAVLDLAGDGHATSVLATTAELVDGETAYALNARPSGGTASEAGVVGPAQRYVGPSGTALDGLEVEGGAAQQAIGGPLVDERGAVVGIVTAVEDDDSWYVTPVEVVHRVAADLLADGVVHHAWLGIECTEVPPGGDTASGDEPLAATGDDAGSAGGDAGDPGGGDAGDPGGVDAGDPGGVDAGDPGGGADPGDGADVVDGGADPGDGDGVADGGAGPGGADGHAGGGTLVASVVEGSPAARGGLEPGDVIVALDGQPIAHMADLTIGLRSRAPGDRVDVTVVHEGARTTLVLTLAEPPPT